ncbi:glycoside hydrolase family 88 protein [Paraliobacillus sediminis]|uniref:glycoside hydrolase family 88/105 protein n=1 Tax=Paraliobacillus sediminis TaxID=1885916 RepID=UPI000E3B765B|nr:glycoside hydrolase family 88 protein [Paraliobacillus sediminis]
MRKLECDKQTIEAQIDTIVNRSFEMNHNWDWPAGVAFYGVCLANKATGNDTYITLLKDWIDAFIDFGIPPMSVNSCSMGHSLLTLYHITKDEKYLNIAVEKADYLVGEAPKFAEGVLQHTVAGKGSVFPEQAWVDTLFMAGYFLIRIGHDLNNETYTKVGLEQFEGHEKYLQDASTNLYYHGWDNINQNNMSGVFWARGNAWAAYTMAAALRNIDVQDASFMTINGSLRDLVSALLQLQSDDGLWHTILTDPTSYQETSASAGIAASLTLTGLHTPRTFQAAQKALDGLLKKIDQQGTVLDVSTGTAVMNNIEGYKMTSKKRIEGWGQGLMLVFLSHVLLTNK